MPIPIDQLRAEDFSTPPEQTLTLSQGAAEVACQVDSVRALAPHPMRREPPFSAVLRGPRRPPLAQGMAALHHPVHGVLDVFIVPIGPCGDGLGYELTFN